MGMLEAMTLKLDKERRGVGMQNMKYPLAFDDFCHLAYMISPQLYNIIISILLGVPSEIFCRFNSTIPPPSYLTVLSSRHKQAGQPRFPIKVTPELFERAANYVRSVGYSGPLALSADDTKLLASLRVYYDKTKQMWFLVGGVGEPMAVANAEELHQIIDEEEVIKATKYISFRNQQYQLGSLYPFSYMCGVYKYH